MSINSRKIFALSLLAFLGLGQPKPVQADVASDRQRILELQQQIDELENQAASYRSNIASERAKGDSLKKEIAILQNQIGAFQAEINSTGAKINQTQLEIGGVQDKIGQTRQDMTRKRETIGRLIFFLEQTDNENLLAAFLKYNNLSDLLSQLHDASSLQSQLLGVVDGLKETKAALEDNKTDLESKQNELQRLNQEAANKKLSLDGVKSQKDRVLRDTKGQEALYQKQLTDIEKKQAAFFKEQQQLEALVVAGGSYIVHITATTLPPKGTKYFSYPEEHPYLTQSYGSTAYSRRGAYGGLPHNGIDLATGYGTPIKAIGPGTLIAHGTNDGWGNWIAIQHPNNMVSLYGHMSRFDASVTVGSVVSQGQVIGYEGNTGNVTGSHVHLSIYKDFFTYINAKGQLYFNYFDGTVNPLDYL